MKPTLDWIDPLTWALFALAAIFLAVGAGESRRGPRRIGSLFLILGAGVLLASIAFPSLLPLRSAIVHRDGSSEDPRVLSALIAAVAACVALLPAWSALRLAPLGAIGALLPGVTLAGLLGAVTFFTRVRAPMALAGVALGGLVLGTAITLAFRASRRPGQMPLLAQACAMGAFAVCVMLALTGPRATAIGITEDTPADTLGHHLALAKVEQADSAHVVMHVRVAAGRDTVPMQVQLVGVPGRELESIADARPFSGPVLVPLAMQLRRQNPHELQWLKKKESLEAPGATVTFVGFRIEQTDSIRMYADLEVKTAAGIEKVSPGMIATATGELPFAATAKGFGPIAAAAFDADNGRVGLMLPQLANASTAHVVMLDLRTRPALPIAWLALALAFVAFLGGLAPVRETRRR